MRDSTEGIRREGSRTVFLFIFLPSSHIFSFHLTAFFIVWLLTMFSIPNFQLQYRVTVVNHSFLLFFLLPWFYCRPLIFLAIVDSVMSPYDSFVPSFADRDFRRVVWSVPCIDGPLLHSCVLWHYREHFDDLSRIAWLTDHEWMIPCWLPVSSIDWWEWLCRSVVDYLELSHARCDWFNGNWRSTRHNDNKY